jgi:hypothetical protein
VTLAAESLLAILIIGLYINDSVTLLHASQALLEQEAGGRWAARLPTRRFTLLRKHVSIGGLLPPNTLLFKLSWTMEGDAPPAPGWEAYGLLLRPYQWLAAGLFILVIILLPVALVARVGDAAVITLLALTYCSVIIAWTALWLGRRRLGLSSQYCLKLGAEMLLCPPVAANLPRRISLQQPVDEDFVSACRRLLRPQEWAEAAEAIAVRIDDELEAEDADSARHRQLTQRKEGLA